MVRIILILFSFFIISLQLQAQMEVEGTKKVTINGYVFDAVIQGTDTIIMADLDDISISSPKEFKNREDYRTYRKYRY